MKKQLKQPNFDAMSKEEVVSFHLEQMQSMQKEVDKLSEAYDVLVENILKMKRLVQLLGTYSHKMASI